MHNRPDLSQQFGREKALHRYISAFEHEELDVMDEILAQAMIDPLLEEMIMEAHDFFQEEDKLTLRENEVVKILDLVAQHLLSAIPDEPISIPDLTVGDILISLREDITLHNSLRKEAQTVYEKVLPAPSLLPKKLGLADVSQLFSRLNISVSAKLQKLFRDKAIILSMGRQQGIERLAAARRQKTQRQRNKTSGEGADL
ncbi:MAG TPA: hypothetical protein VFV38_43345 [Ktedonobacteraceae bacterium]|nr:hypothetical protein [Ktedonobacteraceae bacterium]